MQKGINERKTGKRYTCDYPGCELAFDRPNRLQRHLNLHNNQRPYKCTVKDCDKSYTNSSHLKRHLQAHTAIAKTYKCLYCSSSISTLSNLKRHYKRAHNADRELYCSKCNIRFRKKNRYEEHEASHNNTLLYNCDRCEKAFVSSMKLKKHQETHKSKNYTCPVESCSKVFEKWAILIKHKQLEHKVEFTCSECKKVCLTKSALQSHMVIHNEDRAALPCPYENCKRLYYFNRNLRNHIRTDHKGNKFTCDICGYSLTTKQKIRLHIMSRHQTRRKEEVVRKKAKRRKDTGTEKRSMLSRLTGISLRPSAEMKLVNRMPTALLRDKFPEESSSYSEDDRTSDVSAKGA